MKFKPLTKEELESVYGKLESFTWKSYDTGKTLRVWFRSDTDAKGRKWIDFMYATTVEEVE